MRTFDILSSVPELWPGVFNKKRNQKKRRREKTEEGGGREREREKKKTLLTETDDINKVLITFSPKAKTRNVREQVCL